MRIIFSIFLVFNLFDLFAQDSPIQLTAKVDKTYFITESREFHAREINRYGYVVKSDSVKQKYYDVTLELKNASSKPVTIWLMSCSYDWNFQINNDYISIGGHPCDKNVPTRVKFKPGESKVYKFVLLKSIKFDYPCEYCVYGKQVEATKLGLIIIDDFFEPKLDFTWGYDLAMQDKSKQSVIWSNSLSLLKVDD